MNHEQPLAESMRPSKATELLGQSIWQEGAPLRRLLEEDRFHALLFWGPPGTGKTSAAQIMGQASNRQLVTLSAVSSGVKDIRQVLERSQQEIDKGAKSLLLFLDEIHRLSKNQQDVLLPAIESGLIRFIGATTENPSFEVNKAILSRCLVFRFESLSEDALKDILLQALSRMPEGQKKTLDDDVLTSIAHFANGDARRSMNLLEAIINISPTDHCDSALLKKIGPQLGLSYDKNADEHYDQISAMIKSIRASHPDAALYYMARMLDSGEDALFIARRLIIAASEDIGNANPHALNLAVSGAQAVHMIGMPEARIILGQVVTFLASSPKSNRSYLATDAALAAVKNKGQQPVPVHLRNAPTTFMKDLGYGADYVYPHDNLEGARKQSYLPPALQGDSYYQASDSGYEKNIQESLKRLKPYS